MENNEEIEEENEPTFDPEYCNEGSYNGIECDLNWNTREGYWFCTTCNTIR